MTRQTDNQFLSAKLAVRRHMLARFHRPKGAGRRRPIVLDACQGAGVIWSVLRREFDVAYQGADVRPRAVGVKVDSARLLAIPGWRFDVVDIDTYGEPWRQWEALCRTARRPVTVFLTIGLIRPGGGNVSAYVRRALGTPPGTPRAILTGLAVEMLPRLLHHPLPAGMEISYAVEGFPHRTARYLGVRLGPAGRGG